VSESKRPTSQGSGAVGGYFERVTGETREYLAEILEENDRLRALAAKREMDSRAAAGAVDRIAGLEKDNRRLRETVAQRNEQVQALTVERQEALAEVASVTAELARLQKDVANAEAEHRNFVDRFAAIDKKNTNPTPYGLPEVTHPASAATDCAMTHTEQPRRTEPPLFAGLPDNAD